MAFALTSRRSSHTATGRPTSSKTTTAIITRRLVMAAISVPSGKNRMAPAGGARYNSGVILVLGGTKFLGRHIVEALAAAEHQVVRFHRGQTQCDLPAG